MFNNYPFFIPDTDENFVPPCMRGAGSVNMNPMMNPMMNHEQMKPEAMKPESVSPESENAEEKIEMMYSNTYFIIYPEVVHHCDMYDKECCGMKIPSNEEFEHMVGEITRKVEPEIEKKMRAESRDDETRQMSFRERGLLRDFIGALFLRELFHRRHRPFRRRRPMPHPYRGY